MLQQFSVSAVATHVEEEDNKLYELRLKRPMTRESRSR